MTPVLVSNFWGEVLLHEMVAQLLSEPSYDAHRPVLARLLVDEARHASLVRRVLARRGCDPLKDGSPTTFTFHRLFEEFFDAGGDTLAAALTEFEALSAPTFAGLVKIARAAGDGEVVSLYSEIIADEVRHKNELATALCAKTAEVARLRIHARERMERLFNIRYIRLYAAYGPAAGAEAPTDSATDMTSPPPPTTDL